MCTERNDSTKAVYSRNVSSGGKGGEKSFKLIKIAKWKKANISQVPFKT